MAKTIKKNTIITNTIKTANKQTNTSYITQDFFILTYDKNSKTLSGKITKWVILIIIILFRQTDR